MTYWSFENSYPLTIWSRVTISLSFGQKYCCLRRAPSFLWSKTLTMNTQALHLDAAFADALPPFNQRLVNSMFTLSTLVGLSVAQLTQGTIVANLGFSEIAFPKPLFHGDTMYAETVVTDKRESKSRPGEGIVTFAHTARNQHGDIVATAVRKTLVRKKAGGAP